VTYDLQAEQSVNCTSNQVKELKKRIAELEKTDLLLQKVLYCCDSLHNDYIQCNYGDAKGWLRHISNAYGDYQDSIDLSKGGA
jgi:hypothetical protein